MIDSTQERIQALHTLYGQLTGHVLPLRFEFIFMWERWLVEGEFTEDDLRSVVSYLKRRIREGKRQKECLLPRNLITNYSNFSEDLSMSRSENRTLQTKPDPRKESVLKATGRSAEVTSEHKSAEQILEQNKLMAAMLSKWKKENL